MEDPTDQMNMLKEKLLDTQNQKGGLKTLPFIIANEALEKVASYGLLPNMILYLMRDYGLGISMGTTILNTWSAATNFLPVVGAFLADCYFGRFRLIGFGSIASLLGMILLWLTAMIPQARPPPCNESTQTCESATIVQLVFLCSSFVLMSIGAGGVRSSSLAFGADQLDKRTENVSFSLERYISLYYLSYMASILLALSCIVYIQEDFGWKVGFGVPASLMFLSALSFFLASPFYIKSKANKSLLTGFAQVLVVSFKNRHLTLPSENTNGLYHQKMGSDLIVPSNKLRFLNKACIIRNPQQDLSSDITVSDPWSLCTVDQVEELKALIKVIPIWSTGIMISVSVSQGSFQVLQANSMDRHLTSNFEIPAGSFGMFTVASTIIWISLYNQLILPLASKIMGKPVGLRVKQRMGIGLLCSCMSMALTAIIESVRRETAIQEGFPDNPQAVVNMSAMWLVPQYCLSGMAEAFNAIGQNEFFYAEFPKSMSSIATTLNGVGLSIGNLLASFIFTTVDNITREGGKESWVSSNISKGHYDYYYWLLFSLSLANFLYYTLCCWAYGPCVGECSKVRYEEEGMRD